MKSLLLFGVLLFAGNSLYAQNNAPVCGIYYDYDAVGQRIKRSHDCRVISDGEAETPPDGASKLAPPGRESKLTGLATSTSKIGVYPNPTSGPYTIALSETPKEPVHFHWYNERGQILTSGVISEQKKDGNIASWADGIYLLQVYMPAGTESFRIVKVTGAR